jgi:hypothetical protein
MTPTKPGNPCAPSTPEATGAGPADGSYCDGACQAGTNAAALTSGDMDWPMPLFVPGPWVKQRPGKCKPLHITIKQLGGKILSNGVWAWPMAVGDRVSAREESWRVVAVTREQYRDVVVVEPA